MSLRVIVTASPISARRFSASSSEAIFGSSASNAAFE